VWPVYTYKAGNILVEVTKITIKFNYDSRYPDAIQNTEPLGLVLSHCIGRTVSVSFRCYFRAADVCS